MQQFYRMVKPILYDIAFKVVMDGDAVYRVELNKGLSRLVYLPMTHLTAREYHPDTGELETDPIQVANYYILNEGYDKQQVYPASECVHFNWGRIELVDDILGRRTLGIWNVSPLEPLRAKLLWKHVILLNDMLWRSVNVPRRHHKLPSEPFDPDKFSGKTREERLERARQAAVKALEDYANQLRLHEVERDFITLDDVEIEVVEPKLKWTDPNQLLEQIDESIYAAIGVPKSAVSGMRGGTFATELVVSSYFFHRSRHLAHLIGANLIKVAIMHLESKHGLEYSDLYDYISVDVYTELFLREQARTVAILSQLGIFSKSELRAMLGYSPQVPEDVLEETLHKSTVQSAGQVAAAEMRRQSPERPETPESKEAKQKT